MKHKNLILFLILVVFVAVTYWFEERGNANKRELEKHQYSILEVQNLGKLIGFQGIKLNFKKVGESFFAADNNLELSSKKVDEFFIILAGLKTKNLIPITDVQKVGRSFYIPDETMKMTFKFENGNLDFVLGKKLDYDQAFYMEVTKNGKSEMFVVKDDSPDPGAYKSDKEYNTSDAKYKRLEVMFLLTNVFFYDTKVFTHQNYDEQKINFKKISISTFRNKKFEIDFEKTVTNPPIMSGLIYDEDNWISFHKTLVNLEGKTIYYPIIASHLEELLSHLDVVDRMGKNYTIDIYKKYGSLTGYFLKTSLNEKLYELRNEDAMYFFINVQDFWKKQLNPTSKEYDLKITFHKDQAKTVQIHVSDKEIFNASSKNNSLRILEVKKLVDFLKTSADHISELPKTSIKDLHDLILDLYFENRHFGVMLEENDLVLIDFDNAIKLHHYIGATVPFNYRIKDFFEK